jgi:hypothetical protein
MVVSQKKVVNFSWPRKWRPLGNFLGTPLFASVGLGVVGVTLLTTVIATPIVIAMEGIVSGAGGLSATGNSICDKVLSFKAKKHHQVMTLAQSKLSTISDHISKVLKDNEISNDEFPLILSEIDKYNQI